MTQIMTSDITFTAPQSRTAAESPALKLVLAVVLAVGAAGALVATGNPFAFAIGAGIIVTLVGAGLSWAAGLTR